MSIIQFSRAVPTDSHSIPPGTRPDKQPESKIDLTKLDFAQLQKDHNARLVSLKELRTEMAAMTSKSTPISLSEYTAKLDKYQALLQSEKDDLDMIQQARDTRDKKGMPIIAIKDQGIANDLVINLQHSIDGHLDSNNKDDLHNLGGMNLFANRSSKQLNFSGRTPNPNMPKNVNEQLAKYATEIQDTASQKDVDAFTHSSRFLGLDSKQQQTAAYYYGLHVGNIKYNPHYTPAKMAELRSLYTSDLFGDLKSEGQRQLEYNVAKENGTDLSRSLNYATAKDPRFAELSEDQQRTFLVSLLHTQELYTHDQKMPSDLHAKYIETLFANKGVEGTAHVFQYLASVEFPNATQSQIISLARLPQYAKAAGELLVCPTGLSAEKQNAELIKRMDNLTKTFSTVIEDPRYAKLDTQAQAKALNELGQFYEPNTLQALNKNPSYQQELINGLSEAVLQNGGQKGTATIFEYLATQAPQCSPMTTLAANNPKFVETASALLNELTYGRDQPSNQYVDYAMRQVTKLPERNIYTMNGNDEKNRLMDNLKDLLLSDEFKGRFGDDQWRGRVIEALLKKNAGSFFSGGEEFGLRENGAKEAMYTAEKDFPLN